MLSRDCDGCGQLQGCTKRYQRVGLQEKVYCPDGTAHLVDSPVNLGYCHCEVSKRCDGASCWCDFKGRRFPTANSTCPHWGVEATY